MKKIKDLAKTGKLNEKAKHKTLNDIKPRTVLEVFSYKEVTTVNGMALVLSVSDTAKKQSDRVHFSLMIGSRFLEDVQHNVPGVVYYGGKVSMKNGKKCHVLQFYKHLDPRIMLSKTDKDSEHTTSEVDKCHVCNQPTDCCLGKCGNCGGHQPIDGSQCVC